MSHEIIGRPTFFLCFHLESWRKRRKRFLILYTQVVSNRQFQSEKLPEGIVFKNCARSRSRVPRHGTHILGKQLNVLFLLKFNCLIALSPTYLDKRRVQENVIVSSKLKLTITTISRGTLPERTKEIHLIKTEKREDRI